MSTTHSQISSVLERTQALFRALPISSSTKKRIQDMAYSRLGALGSGNAGYEEWKRLKVDRAQLGEARVRAPTGQMLELAEYLGDRSKPAILFATHRGGGGTEVHVQELARMLEEENVQVYFLRPAEEGMVEFTDRGRDAKIYLSIDRDRALLVDLLRSVGVVHIHVHNLLDWPPGACDAVRTIAAELGVEYDFTVHDYLCFCPRFNLFDPGVQSYCGEPATVRCNLCIATYGSPAGNQIDVAEWRLEYDRFLSEARCVFAPTVGVGDRILRYFPHLEPVIRPHPERRSTLPTPRRGPDSNGRRSILVLGDLRTHKGSRVLLACAKDAARRDLPLSFTVLGQSDQTIRLKRTGRVSVRGRYEPDDLDGLLKDGIYDLAFIPAVWPETYSYTLSEIWLAGLHPVAFDIGAIGERIRGAVGTLLPYDMVRDPAGVNNALLQIVPREFGIEDAGFVQYERLTSSYYGLEELTS